MRRSAVLLVPLLLGFAFTLVSREPKADPRLQNAFRRPAQNGWIFVHLEGPPSVLGFQHGYLLAPEILDAHKEVVHELTHDSGRNWQFFRDAAQNLLWPRVETEYREEMQGMVEGLHAKGVKMDLWDVVATNAWLEFPYYIKWYDKQHNVAPPPSTTAPEHCSAFVATGRYTKDGRVVIGHNNWSSYMSGERWNIIFDIVPSRGHRILMDGMAGLIHSGDDFGLNSAGIIITETTISRFHGWNPDGIPEFVRARKAMQYSSSIDDFARIMQEDNNGGYANDWLVADSKNNEIASLELGLQNVTLQRTKDGVFVGANFPINPKLTRDETDFDIHDQSLSPNARHIRWEELMIQYKGKIDVKAGQSFLSDHFDTYEHKNDPDERTLCGHIDLSPRGSPPWMGPYGIAGTVQAKVADAAMADRMSLTASLGHPCGISFHAAKHLREHPEFDWQKDYLHDMISQPWTTFTAAR